jgi:hypothetical protein
MMSPGESRPRDSSLRCVAVVPARLVDPADCRIPRAIRWFRRRFVAIFLMGTAVTFPMSAGAQEPAFDADASSRSLLFGWGHSWGPGWPGWGHTETDVGFAAFHPQMGWFASDRLELYGEGTLLAYHQPGKDISAGLVGIGGRYHFSQSRWAPYVTMGGGLIWTTLDIREIDRVFNFQVLYGIGIRRVRDDGPGWRVEVRNHHISNAGTAGENFGINAITVLAGFDWILK